jgi:hypothetical protein
MKDEGGSTNTEQGAVATWFNLSNTNSKRNRVPASKVDFAGNEFRVSSCDFVDRSFWPVIKDDPRSHTNQHEPKHSSLKLDPTFEAKLRHLRLFAWTQLIAARQCQMKKVK